MFVQKIGRWIENLFALVFALTVMPILIFMLVVLPISNILTAIHVVRAGYGSGTESEMVVLAFAILLFYLSLRFKFARKVYFAIPFLFETLKYFLFAAIFTTVGYIGVNRAYANVVTAQHMRGIGFFVGMLIVWRIFIYRYYVKRELEPLEEVMYVN